VCVCVVFFFFWRGCIVVGGNYLIQGLISNHVDLSSVKDTRYGNYCEIH